MSDPIKDQLTVELFEWRTNTNTRLMVNIPEIWSKYQKDGHEKKKEKKERKKQQ